MASTSRFWYNKVNSSNGTPSNSAFKWTSQMNNSKAIQPKRSTSVPNFSTWTPHLQFNSTNRFDRTSNFGNIHKQVVKVVDDARIRTSPIVNQMFQKKSRPMIAAHNRTPLNESRSSAYIRYDPDSRTLVKTIDLRPISIPASVQLSARPTTFKPKSTPMAAAKAQDPKTVVSRFKVIRNSVSAQTGRPNKTSKWRPINHQKKTLPSGSGLLKLISKYKIRRRSSSFSTTSPVKKRIGLKAAMFWRSRGDLVNRFKIVRQAPKVVEKKKVYKLDRRKHDRPVRSSVGQQALKYRKRIWVSSGAKKNGDQKSRDRHCLFYIRYGRCCRGPSCPFIHDPEKIAVCTRFLRGTCNVRDCPFSHVVSPDKMPVCRFFLLGKCNRSDCPYLHVKHGESTEKCADFERGYCPKGAKCEKKHVSRPRKRKLPEIAAGEKAVVMPISGPVPKVPARTSAGVFLANVLRQHLASRPKPAVSIDLSSGPLPEFIPLVKETEN